jgi:hypothetical protein
MMWFLFVVAAIAYATKPYENAVYRNELRHLPEKLKQERIQQTVQNTFALVQDQVMKAAIRNTTETNFTLFCLEPNSMSGMFRKQGSTYRLVDPDDSEYSELREMYSRHGLEPLAQEKRLSVKPRCLAKDGYELYNRYYSYPSWSPDHPYYVPLDFSHHTPGISYTNLEQEPILYIQQFFQRFNQQFPDLTLSISQQRMAEGIFETECCPVYTVSW